jgi:hypothetical protein
VSRFVTAGAGFLLAVLWFDLMFDVQVIGKRGVVLPEAVLASIAGYYRRVTSAARPMNRLIATVMVATLAALVVEVAHVHGRGWAPWTSLGLAGAPIVLAASHTVPGAVRLGSGSDPPERQSALARSILRDHLLCLVLIAALLVVQLAAPGLD